MNRMRIFPGSVDSLEVPESRKCSTWPVVIRPVASISCACSSDGFGGGFVSSVGIDSAAIWFIIRAVSVCLELVPLYR